MFREHFLCVLIDNRINWKTIKFIEIFFIFQEDIVPEMHVRFGQETLYLEGWCARTQYNACCRLLGPGINIHLAENQLLREIFHLGNKVLPITSQKTTKLERVSIQRRILL